VSLRACTTASWDSHADIGDRVGESLADREQLWTSHFGQPIGKFQAIADNLAAIYVRLAAPRLLISSMTSSATN